MNLSFAGCGFVGTYHLGVASCIKTYAPYLLENKISGASAGSGVALALVLDIPLGDVVSDCLAMCQKARYGFLGPFSPSFNVTEWLRSNMEKTLPENAHEIATGKLHVSLTKVYDGKNMMANTFDSRQELIEVILASCFIPVFSGIVPARYRGHRVIDGGYSDNCPVLDSSTITVSPFAGTADICPQGQLQDSGFPLSVSFSNTAIEMSPANMARMVNIIFPPGPDILAKYCKQGFDDCLRFLQARHLITCTRSMGVATTYSIESETADADYHDDDSQNHLEKKQTPPPKLQQSIDEVFDKYAQKVDQSYGQIIKDNKILKVFVYPSMVFLHTIMWLISHFFPGLSRLAARLADRVLRLVPGDKFGANLHLARYVCDINITQYGEEDEGTDFTKYRDTEDNDTAVRDILSLEMVTRFEAEESPILPDTQEAAIRFQKENLSAAVASRAGSGVTSLATSRRGSCVSVSRGVSRGVSRVNSCDSLDTGGHVTGTMEQIRHVTETQDPVMSFFFTQDDKEVKMMEIFDVTETDPSLLVIDNKDDLSSSLRAQRSRHCSAPSSLRRGSLPVSAVSGLVPSRIQSIEDKIARTLQGFNGDIDSDSFSDPESEQIMK